MKHMDAAPAAAAAAAAAPGEREALAGIRAPAPAPAAEAAVPSGGPGVAAPASGPAAEVRVPPMGPMAGDAGSLLSSALVPAPRHGSRGEAFGQARREAVMEEGTGWSCVALRAGRGNKAPGCVCLGETCGLDMG